MNVRQSMPATKAASVIPKLVPVGEVAERIGLTTRTLKDWSKQGKFPRAYRLNRQLFFREDDVVNWLEERPGDPEQDWLREDYQETAALNGETRQRRGSGPLVRGNTSSSRGGLYAP